VGREDANVPGARRDGDLGRRDRYAEDPPRGSFAGVASLEVAEADARDGVARDDDQATTLLEEALHALLGEVEDRVDVAAAVGRAAGVTEVEKIAFGQRLAEAAEDGEPAEAGVVDADHRPRRARVGLRMRRCRPFALRASRSSRFRPRRGSTGR